MQSSGWSQTRVIDFITKSSSKISIKFRLANSGKISTESQNAQLIVIRGLVKASDLVTVKTLSGYVYFIRTGPRHFEFNYKEDNEVEEVPEDIKAIFDI